MPQLWKGRLPVLQGRLPPEQQLHHMDEAYADRSAFVRAQARLPYLRSLGEMKELYGHDLDAMSHGESFLTLFSARLKSGGVFVLDEPEAPLSPLRQLALLHMIHDSAGTGSQFIIATHSPLLMAYPGAGLYTLNDGAIVPAKWDELEHRT